MNSPPETTDSELLVVDSAEALTDPLKEPEQRGRGKIAQLPKVLRDRVNTLLDDGLPYGRLIEELQKSKDPPLPYPISEMNLSRWKDGGYQQHLAQQERVAYVRANREAALEMVANDDTTTLPEGALQMIASHYYEVLGGFAPGSLQKKLGDDPLKYTRFINAFSRLSREILNLKKYREDCAIAVIAELKKLDPQREFNEREDQILTERMDNYFKKPRRKPQAENLAPQGMQGKSSPK